MIEREQLIDKLVGVQSSKQNYYTQLKQTILELEKKNTQLEIINDVMRSFNIEMSMDEMLRHILEKLNKIYPFQRLGLNRFDKETDELYVTNVYPTDTTYPYIGTFIPIEQSIYWEVVEQNNYKNYHLSEEKSYTEDKSFLHIGLQQVLIFPLRSKGNIIGTFSLGTEDTLNFEQAEINFFQQLSDQLAVSIENVFLYQKMLQSKEEWEQTFSAVLDAIVLVDLNGKILRANEAGSALLTKYRCMENIHTLLYETMLPTQSMIQQCASTEQVTYEEIKIAEETYEVYAYPSLNDENELYHIILYMKDVTNKQLYEMQLIQSSKLAAIGEMAAGVAHELNNPLTAILGNTQLLLRKAKEQMEISLLEDVLGAGKRCQNIVRNLLTFSRQDAYLFEKCSMNEAVQTVLSLVGYQISQNHIKLETDLQENLSLFLGSIQQIEQVIINILLNAQDELVHLNRHDGQIIISSRECADAIYLSVQDNGMGLTESEKQNIFDPFYTTKEIQKGTGLGLSVSLGIVASHHGEIFVQSEKGVGSTFTIKLPKCE